MLPRLIRVKCDESDTSPYAVQLPTCLQSSMRIPINTKPAALPFLPSSSILFSLSLSPSRPLLSPSPINRFVVFSPLLVSSVEPLLLVFECRCRSRLCCPIPLSDRHLPCDRGCLDEMSVSRRPTASPGAVDPPRANPPRSGSMRCRRAATIDLVSRRPKKGLLSEGE